MSTFVEQRTEFVIINCGHRGNGCGIDFAVTRAFYDNIHNNGVGWYCPNGHCRVFTGPTAADRLKEAQTALLAKDDQLSAAIREAEAQRQEMMRIRSRIAHGVCIGCNRSFGNVRNHMQSQHPQLVVPASVSKTYKCGCGRNFESYMGLRRHQSSARGRGWDAPQAARWDSHLTVVS